MSDLLAIVGSAEEDEALLEEIARGRPDRVTLLVEGGAAERTPRFTRLRRAIEERTGAIVVGLAASRAQLAGWRFDRTVGHGRPLTA